MSYEAQFHDESDADDEYERSVITSPTLPAGYDSTSPTDSDPPSNEHTPTTFTHSTANAVSPRGLITEWGPEQVASFVASLGLESYRPILIHEGITGEVLVQLSQSNLKDMGINSVGHKLTILKAVYEVKLKQNIAIEEGDYVPLSADANAPDAHATQDDVARIIHQIKLRDERIKELEIDLRTMRDDLTRVQDEQKKLREDTLPALRALKNQNQPLPTPDGLESHPNPLSSPNPNNQNEQPKSAGGLVRKPSKKDWFRGVTGKIPSPTIHDGSNLQPSAAAVAASDHLTSSFNSDSRGSPHLSNQPSPTSPPYANGTNPSRLPPTNQQPSRGGQHTPSDTNTMWNHSNASTIQNPNPPQSGRQPPLRPERGPPSANKSRADAAENDPTGFMKSFRVSMEEPCHKVLPVALKKYQIQDDPAQYSLYIVHGDEERCLGMDEKPLILFKQLANDGKKPMFMLRKHATPPDGFSNTRGEGSTGYGSRNVDVRTAGRMSSYSSYNSALPGGVY